MIGRIAFKAQGRLIPAGLAGLILASCVALTYPAYGAETKKSAAVDIESNAMEILDNKNQAIFTGKVIAKREDVTLNGEKLVVDFVKTKKPDGSSKNEVTILNATGNIIIVTAKQHITGAWAKMDVKGDMLWVGGNNVVVKQGSTIMKGKKLTVNLKTKRSQMTGGRVRGRFIPAK